MLEKEFRCLKTTQKLLTHFYRSVCTTRIVGRMNSKHEYARPAWNVFTTNRDIAEDIEWDIIGVAGPWLLAWASWAWGLGRPVGSQPPPYCWPWPYSCCFSGLIVAAWIRWRTGRSWPSCRIRRSCIRNNRLTSLSFRSHRAILSLLFVSQGIRCEWLVCKLLNIATIRLKRVQFCSWETREFGSRVTSAPLCGAIITFSDISKC